MTLNMLISGHAKFKDSYAKHRSYWARLAVEGQFPRVLWIGCSDSRVIPEQITGSRPGDLFVMRNIANVVPPYGTTGDAASAVLEYAILGLGVEHIIVCGHTHCGGVKAIMDQESQDTTSHVARWVSWIRPALSQVEALSLPEEDRYLETIKTNILIQRRNLEGYPEVTNALKSGRLSVHGWLFDIESGDLLAYDDVTNKWQPVDDTSTNEQATILE